MTALRKFIKICHWAITGFHLVCIYYGLAAALQNPEDFTFDKDEVEIARLLQKTSMCLYISLWGLVLHIVYFMMVSLLEVFDTVPSLSKMTTVINQLESIRKHFFASLVFPLSLCVGAVFWLLYAYDREQIYPKMLDTYLPKWLNHAVHTIPPIVAFFHIFIADLTSINTKNCLAVLIGINAFYNFCFICSGLVYGNWVYLFCRTLPGVTLAVGISLCNLSTVLCFAFVTFSRPYTKRIREFVMNENYKKIN